MKRNIYSLLIGLFILLSACESIVEDVNENPNDFVVEDIDPVLFLNGMMLADIQVNVGHVVRISGAWNGHYIGFQQLYQNLYQYNITAAETNGIWAFTYQGVLAQGKSIRSRAEDDLLLAGITRVLEAHSLGTLTSLFGDIPLTEAVTEAEDPVFDSQMNVLAGLQTKLDDAIADLERADGRAISQDIIFGGDKDKWIETAWTLKARYYMLARDYENAYNAALNGISSDDNSMLYIPPANFDNFEDANTMFSLLSGSRSGDIGTTDFEDGELIEESYVMQLMNDEEEVSRNNAKTDETARREYLTVERDGGASRGVAAQDEPMNLVTFEENNLILAEAGARTQSFAVGLGHLNDHREFLNSGAAFPDFVDDFSYNYEAYVAADFQNGGIENPDNVSQDLALLREIIEERYISGFGTTVPFDDTRRIRRDPDAGVLSVPFPLSGIQANNVPNGTPPERFIYSQNELNSNPNAVEARRGLFEPTPVNTM